MKAVHSMRSQLRVVPPFMVLLIAVVFGAVSLPCGTAAVTAAETLTLNPNAGDPPSASGSLSGTDWLCSDGAAPGGSATVSGSGVGGFANLGRTGDLTGDVHGPRERRRYRRGHGDGEHACPGIRPRCAPCHATALFTFTAPIPTPTRTPRPSPTEPPPTAAAATSTPTPAPATMPPGPTAAPTKILPGPTGASTPAGAPGSPTNTPAPGGTATAVAPSGTRVLRFSGCTPTSPLALEFVPLYVVGAEAASNVPSGPGISVPAVQLDDGSGGYAFEPPLVDPGRLFRVSLKLGDPDCPTDPEAPPTYWLTGDPVILPTLLPKTTLEACAVVDKTPCEYPEVKGAFVRRGEPASIPEDSAAAMAVEAWETEKNYYAEQLKGKQRFRSSTELAASKSAKLQASVLPFPKGDESDPMAPDGLVATWDIACVNCEFTVDLSPLAPVSPPAKKHWYKSTFDVVTKPIKWAGQGVKAVFGKIGDVVGIGGGKKSGAEVVEAGKAQLPAVKPGDYLVAGAANPLAHPTTYYFRLLPLEGDAAVGAVSNSVRFQQVDKPAPIVIVNPSPTATPTESPYEVKIIAYHGIIPPQVGNKICYIATQDAWPKSLTVPFAYTTDKSKAAVTGTSLDVKKGQAICPPDPKEPDLLAKIVAWAEYVVDWTSEAWTDLKDFAVNVVLKYTPLGLMCTSVEQSGAIPGGACATAFHMALDTALLALGIPPDVPNFHELLDQGIDYLAAEAAAQVGIPPEVVQAAVKEGGPLAGLALDAAEDQLREELQAQIKAKLGEAATSIELGRAAAVSWVPDGIPVRPDDYQPPAMSVRVTRKAGVSGGDDGCTLHIRDSMHLAQTMLDNPPAGYGPFVKNLTHPLDSLTPYDIFGDEAGLGIDKELNVPALAPGKSFIVPMTFKPNYYKSGWSPSGLIKLSEYINVWRFLHDFGSVKLSADGCGSDTLTTPANGSIIAAAVGNAAN